MGKPPLNGYYNGFFHGYFSLCIEYRHTNLLNYEISGMMFLIPFDRRLDKKFQFWTTNDGTIDYGKSSIAHDPPSRLETFSDFPCLTP